MNAWRIVAAAALFGFALVLREPLEGHPVTHMLVQMPALALVGALLAPPALGRGEWNRGGVASLLTAIFAAAVWMLPRSIDAAVSDPVVDAVKFATLPLLVGLPLAIGWRRVHPLLGAFVKAQALSMLGVLAFLYTHAPVRICNSYLAEDQFQLGIGFLLVGIALALLWTAPLLVGEAPARHGAPPAPA